MRNNPSSKFAVGLAASLVASCCNGRRRCAGGRYEGVLTDVLARFKRIEGKDVIFQTGPELLSAARTCEDPHGSNRNAAF